MERASSQEHCVEISIHDAIKDTKPGGTTSTDSPPHMNIEWMLRFRLALCGFVRHSEAPATMRLWGDRALVAENHVLESVATWLSWRQKSAGNRQSAADSSLAAFAIFVPWKN